ncbi:hypothetical protein RF11_04405 [Thelohanellus kitauei]|uniref:Uncharacterized protein n=1 Tax=Thelohanellus kitauei TaxID=669202 RepID=A0A0C2I6P6_THEKT|nr:hypothetical protein RF11_04405 [Thelohanellus kitauei]
MEDTYSVTDYSVNYLQLFKKDTSYLLLKQYINFKLENDTKKYIEIRVLDVAILIQNSSQNCTVGGQRTDIDAELNVRKEIYHCKSNESTSDISEGWTVETEELTRSSSTKKSSIVIFVVVVIAVGLIIVAFITDGFKKLPQVISNWSRTLYH